MNGMTRGNWVVVLVVIVAASIVLFVQLDAVPRPVPLTPTPTAVAETCVENIAVVMTGTSESGVIKPVKINVRVAIPCGK